MSATQTPSQGNVLRRALQSPSLQEGAGLIGMFVIIVIVMSVLSPYFLSTQNFLNLWIGDNSH